MTSETLTIEVAYALPNKQQIVTVDVTPGTAALEAVKQSTITQAFPEIDLEKIKMGVFGKAIKSNYELKAGDRIEIYRPLKSDPKASRKARADKAKAKK